MKILPVAVVLFAVAALVWVVGLEGPGRGLIEAFALAVAVVAIGVAAARVLVGRGRGGR